MSVVGGPIVPALAAPSDDETALIPDDEFLLVPIHPIDAEVDVAKLDIIQSSPYREPEHLLDLSTLDRPYALLAIALRSFINIVPRYAFEDYKQNFNFGQVADLVGKLSAQIGYQFPGLDDVYIVVFKSALRPEHLHSSEKRQILADIDKASHEEANISGGLLKYWFGTPDSATGRNLATCLWRSRADAKAGGGGQAHRQGMRRVAAWFSEWHIEQYRLTIHPGATGYKIEPYEDK